jgi:hypothetical protein
VAGVCWARSSRRDTPASPVLFRFGPLPSRRRVIRIRSGTRRGVAFRDDDRNVPGDGIYPSAGGSGALLEARVGHYERASRPVAIAL